MIKWDKLFNNIRDRYLELLSAFVHKKITYEQYETLDMYPTAITKLRLIRKLREAIEIKVRKVRK